MDLVLDQGRPDFYLRQEVGQLLHIPVGQAQGADLPLRRIGFHRPVGLDVPRPGMVEEHHVDIAQVQLFQRHVDGRFRMAELVRINLGDHEDFLPGDAVFRHRLPDAFAHRLFVAVHVRRVDQPAASGQESLDRLNAGIMVQRIGAQAQDGHGISAVQQDGFRLKIKLSHFELLLFRAGRQQQKNQPHRQKRTDPSFHAVLLPPERCPHFPAR